MSLLLASQTRGASLTVKIRNVVLGTENFVSENGTNEVRDEVRINHTCITRGVG